MPALDVFFELASFWHVGTGSGAGPVADATVVRSPAGLPLVPGKQVKGLLRDGMETAAAAGLVAATEVTRLFGSNPTVKPAPVQGNPDREVELEACRFLTTPGVLVFDSAVLGEDEAQSRLWESWARSEGARSASRMLFRHIAATSIEDGVALDHTLRVIEVVVPLRLRARVRALCDDGVWAQLLEKALPFVEGVGGHRTRGLGRARVFSKEVAP